MQEIKINVSQQGDLVKISPIVKRMIFPHRFGRGDRAIITEFSRRSRKNMMERFAIIDEDRAKNATFITLTYIENFQDPVEGYRHLDLFLKRLAYRSPDIFAVWKKEPQNRGAIHYHVMIWNLPWVDKEKIGQMWGEITGQWMDVTMKDGSIKTMPPFTRIEYCKSRKKCWFYISKYIAKETVTEGDKEMLTLERLQRKTAAANSTWIEKPIHDRTLALGERISGFINGSNSEKIISKGRFWGWFNRKNIPYAKEIETTIEMTWAAYKRFRWDLRNWAEHTRETDYTHTVKMFWFVKEIDPVIMLISAIQGTPFMKGWGNPYREGVIDYG